VKNIFCDAKPFFAYFTLLSGNIVSENYFIFVYKINDMTNNVAEKIKRLRKSKGFSQDDMAERMHISQSAYARIETGESHSWAAHIEKLSEILEVKPEDFLTDETNSFSSLDQLGGFAFQNVGTITTINSFLSEKFVEQYEERIKELKEQVEFWKNKSEGSK
jgi:transcriptional regulator with XRE-family HTH domain